jgi:hypothetical protein
MGHDDVITHNNLRIFDDLLMRDDRVGVDEIISA